MRRRTLDCESRIGPVGMIVLEAVVGVPDQERQIMNAGQVDVYMFGLLPAAQNAAAEKQSAIADHLKLCAAHLLVSSSIPTQAVNRVVLPSRSMRKSPGEWVPRPWANLRPPSIIG